VRHLRRDERVQLMDVGVFIDSCAVNRLALINVDPTKELAGSELRLAITPDLETEYRRALDHVFVPPYVKSLIRRLLERCERRWFSDDPPDADLVEMDFEPDAGRPAIVEVRALPPRHRTDLDLVTLAMRDLVITDDRTQIRRWGQDRPGLIPWLEIEANRDAGGRLIELLRERAKRLPGKPQRITPEDTWSAVAARG